MLARPAMAAPPADAAVTVAAPDKVYPPLPSLSMLPPSAAEAADDGTEAVPSSARARSGKRQATASVPVALVRKQPGVPVPRLVVSEATRAYLAGVEQQLDRALKR